MTTDLHNLPIGVFDSGLGGLTVVREIKAKMPFEDILYLGDSARVPYGTRSPKTVIEYARKCANFLLEKNLKILVIACNTASAYALSSLKRESQIEVTGVISAGAKAVADENPQSVGIIGTSGTVNSNAYPDEIAAINPKIKVFQNAAPLFVPLAEEGWVKGKVPDLVAIRYLEPFVPQNIELLLLGCTHYPLLIGTIKSALENMGSRAKVIDSATVMAREVHLKLKKFKLLNNKGQRGKLTCYVTDLPKSFADVAGRFLGEDIDRIKKVDVV